MPKLREVPARTPDQRMVALDRANEIRRYRAILKRGLKACEVDPISVLADVDPRLDTMRLVEFLTAIPGIGPTNVHKILNSHPVISYRKTLAGLTPRQRSVVMEDLAHHLRVSRRWAA